MRQRLVYILLMATCLYACGEPEPSPNVQTEPPDMTQTGGPLVFHTSWTAVAEADDPYAERRPDAVPCDESAWTTEDFNGEMSLEISTGRCDYLTVEQSAAAAGAAGDELVVRLWQFEITRSEPAEAFAALRVDDRELWTDTLELPRESGLLEGSVVLDEPIVLGDSVLFHLDNHGTNTWDLIEVSIQPANDGGAP